MVDIMLPFIKFGVLLSKYPPISVVLVKPPNFRKLRLVNCILISFLL